jgi:hypothetical protein
MVPMFNLLAGCIWPGGVGGGLYGFLERPAFGMNRRGIPESARF